MIEDNDKNIDIDFSLFEDDTEPEPQTTTRSRKFRHPKLPFNIKPARKLLIGGGIVIVIIIMLFFLFSGDDASESRTGSKDIGAKLDSIEETLQKMSAETADSNALLEAKINTLTQELRAMKRTMGSRSVRTGSTGTSQTQPASSTNSRYHTIRRGENLSMIAKRYGLSVPELCSLNDMTTRAVIHPGQKLRIK
jgi:LysM repeat protein